MNYKKMLEEELLRNCEYKKIPLFMNENQYVHILNVKDLNGNDILHFATIGNEDKTNED